MATKKAQKEQARQEAISRLRKLLKPGQTVYTVCTSVSGSGMYRHIKLVVPAAKPDKYDTVRDISGDVSTVLDWKWHDDGSVGVSGCGMDMGFHVVNQLSYALYGDIGYKCLGAEGKCPSAFHQGENYRKVSSEHHHDGYALKQRWL